MYKGQQGSVLDTNRPMTGSNSGERSPSPDFVRDSLASSSVVSVSDTGSDSDMTEIAEPYAPISYPSSDPTEDWWAYVLEGI